MLYKCQYRGSVVYASNVYGVFFDLELISGRINYQAQDQGDQRRGD